MAQATHLTIGTADRIRLSAKESDESREDEVRQEVQVSITYALEAGDTDLAAVAEDKADEVQRAHERAWHRIGALSPSVPGCSCRHEEDIEQEDIENNGQDENGLDDNPLAGTHPSWHEPPLGGPSPSASARPYPPAPPREEGRSVNGGSSEAMPEPDSEPVTGPQRILIRSRAKKSGLTPYALESLVFQQFKVWKVERLSKEQASALLAALERDLEEKQDGKETGPHADRNGHAATA